jgi:hypothetical protein
VELFLQLPPIYNVVNIIVKDFVGILYTLVLILPRTSADSLLSQSGYVYLWTYICTSLLAVMLGTSSWLILSLVIWGSHGGEDVILVFWVVKPCGLVGRYQRFRGTYCLHLKGWNLKDGGNMFFRNFAIYLQVHTALQLRKPTSISSSLENLKSHMM